MDKAFREIRAALEKTGLPWNVEAGSKHFKIRLSGRLVGIFPQGKWSSTDRRAILNTISTIRRMARELKGEQ